jgi:hypothetical protein
MSSGRVFFALVAAYVGIVLWCLAYGDSLQALARLRARLRHGRARLGSRRYLTGALAGAAVAGLAAAAVFGLRDFAPERKAAPEAAHSSQSADPASLRPSRALAPPVAAADTPARTKQSPEPRARVRRAPEKHPKVVSNLVSVSARVTPAAGTTSSAQGLSSDGPTPLPAPPENSAPSPLAAP